MPGREYLPERDDQLNRQRECTGSATTFPEEDAELVAECYTSLADALVHLCLV